MIAFGALPLVGLANAGVWWKLAKAAAKQAGKNKDADIVDSSKASKPQVEKTAEKADEAGGKSKAELKAERRAKQEAQRAAKEGQKLQAAAAAGT